MNLAARKEGGRKKRQARELVRIPQRRKRGPVGIRIFRPQYSETSSDGEERAGRGRGTGEGGMHKKFTQDEGAHRRTEREQGDYQSNSE